MVCGGGGMPGGTERLVLRGTARLLPETRSVGADKVSWGSTMQIGSRHGLCDTMVRKYEYESRKGTVKMVQCSSPSDICMICIYLDRRVLLEVTCVFSTVTRDRVIMSSSRLAIPPGIFPSTYIHTCWLLQKKEQNFEPRRMLISNHS